MPALDIVRALLVTSTQVAVRVRKLFMLLKLNEGFVSASTSRGCKTTVLSWTARRRKIGVLLEGMPCKVSGRPRNTQETLFQWQ